MHAHTILMNITFGILLALSAIRSDSLTSSSNGVNKSSSSTQTSSVSDSYYSSSSPSAQSNSYYYSSGPEAAFNQTVSQPYSFTSNGHAFNPYDSTSTSTSSMYTGTTYVPYQSTKSYSSMYSY